MIKLQIFCNINFVLQKLKGGFILHTLFLHITKGVITQEQYKEIVGEDY